MLERLPTTALLLALASIPAMRQRPAAPQSHRLTSDLAESRVRIPRCGTLFVAIIGAAKYALHTAGSETFTNPGGRLDPVPARHPGAHRGFQGEEQRVQAVRDRKLG